MIYKDGHIHSPFCPHGTKDRFEEYAERAISLGFHEISFTEHAPLPEGFNDTVPEKDSAMSMDDLPLYLETIRGVKKKYGGRLQINAGLEVDFIEGFEEQTAKFLDLAGPELDDAILSVHFIKHRERYDCIDYSPEMFSLSAERHGGLENLYRKYYETVLASVKADLGKYKPKRIGHITLVHKFQKKFPAVVGHAREISAILNEMKKQKLELDYNGAGTAKPLCREPYPPDHIVREALSLGIRLVYGSDAHSCKEMGQGIDFMPFIDSI